MKKHRTVKDSAPPGSDAASVSGEFQDRNMRLTNCWMVCELVLSTSGQASSSTSR